VFGTRSQRENLIQTATPALRLPVGEKTLANGMRVVLHPDRSAPIVAVHVMFHAGSKDERPGRTGLAHLLEHLLFEGTENCPRGEFDRLLEGVGGTNNGSTWLDRTNYYEVVPTHALELALWLERERMGYFLPVLGPEMLEVQRGVVINERRQVYENRPYGMADERLHQILFPAEHPYSWPTIGYEPDLKAIELDDARSFFEKYYAPGNAVLVMAGDVEMERGFDLAEEFFGDLPAGPDIRRAADGLAIAGGTETMPDRVSFPRMYRAHATPGYGTADWVALDVLSYLLGDGESSRLQRELVRDSELAQDVDTYLYPTELAGMFGIVATARSGVDGRRIADAVDRAVRQVAESGVREREVEGAIRRCRRDHLAGVSTMEGRADELAYAATVLGDAAALADVLESYGSVTAEDLQRVALAHLAIDGGAVLTVVPDGEVTDED
jgi:zinc protease